MRIILVTFLPILSFFIFLSCKKHGCMDEYAINYDATAQKNDNKFCNYKKPEVDEYIPVYGANTATLVAIDRGIVSSYSPWGDVNTWRYTLGAKFTLNGKDLEQAGNVSMSVYSQELVSFPNDHNIIFNFLNKSSNNSYIKIHSNMAQLPPSYFPNPTEWKGEGNVWPSFNTINSRSFPAISKVMSGSPNVSGKYTFQVKPLASADSLVLEIFGQRKRLTKVIPSNLSMHVFSKEEIESVGRGDAYLRVVSVNYETEVVGGKTYFMLNQKRNGKEVYIQ